MTKQQHVTKAVLQHGWSSLDDWVHALDELADLTDEQIDQVAAAGKCTRASRAYRNLRADNPIRTDRTVSNGQAATRCGGKLFPTPRQFDI